MLDSKGVIVSMGSDDAVNQQTDNEEYIRVALNTKFDRRQLAFALAEVAGTIKEVCRKADRDHPQIPAKKKSLPLGQGSRVVGLYF